MINHDELLSIWEGYDGSIKKNNPTYSGLLGLTIDGEQKVEHPTRNGFVYFRFRDNLSEVVLAFNDKVAPVYDLPVVVERVRNNWRVIGRDTDRYSNWGSSAPYLPKHGFQHSFDRDAGTGGDVVLVYPDQFIPLLVYPSGTFGAGNLQVGPHLLQRDSDFLYVGNTGTSNILPYKPTNSNAIMGLVYLDRETGNPGFLINSGTSFNAAITGTAGVSPYIPYPSSTQEPLYAFRLVSGTETLRWENLYNARQFIGGGQGGSSMITGGYMDLTTNQVAAGVKRFSDSIQIGIEPPAAESDGGLSQASEGASVANFLWTWGAGFASFITGLFARGTKASPTAALKDDVLFRWRARAYDGSTYGNTSVEIRGVADEDHNTSGHGTRLEIWATPTGTTTLTKMMTVESSGNINIGSGTYNINGVPVSSGGGGVTSPYAPTGRLSLASGTPVTITDLTAQTSIYYTPYKGDVFSYYDGSEWVNANPGQIQLPLDSNSGHTNYHASGTVFDVFLFRDGVSGPFRLGSGPGWSSLTSRGYSLSYRDGILMNAATMTIRYGNASGDTTSLVAERAVYVGTFYATANGQTEDSDTRRMLWNTYNRASRFLNCSDSTNSWAYTTAAFRPSNNSTSIGVGRVAVVLGLAEDVIQAYNVNSTRNTNTAPVVAGGIGIDSTTINSAQVYGLVIGVTNSYLQHTSYYRGTPSIGYHYIQRLEYSEAVGTSTWAGDVNSPGVVNQGLIVDIMG